MRIDLALEDSVFQVLFLLLILHLSVHEADHVFRHLVNAPPDNSQLVLPFYGRIPGKVPFRYKADFVPNLVHGLADGAVQYIGQHQSHQADDDDNGADKQQIHLVLGIVVLLREYQGNAPALVPQGTGYHPPGGVVCHAY